jgi:fructose-bisphosphate aldolase class 1
MSYIKRSDIVDYQTYGDMRDSFREQVLRAKDLRRVHVGPYLTFLFENKLTIRYQIQEMMRLEKMVRESDIEHEIKTYNGLLGAPGELILPKYPYQQ